MNEMEFKMKTEMDDVSLVFFLLCAVINNFFVIKIALKYH